MKFDIIQTNKDLFRADFSICENELNVGEICLMGRVGSMECKWNGELKQTHFTMIYEGSFAHKMPQCFRPYKISINGEESGFVYQTAIKQSFFKKADYEQMQLSEDTYDLFPIGFGNEGSKNPIYCNDIQVALIEKKCVVYNDLHKYHITAIDDVSAFASVMFCCYMFTNACYKPGVKVTNSISKTVSTTTNRLLLEKYNPDFIKNI